MNSETNVVSIAPKKGRQVGQRVQSLDLRAYKALIDFDLDQYHYDSKSDLVDAIIVRLRDREIF